MCDTGPIFCVRVPQQITLRQRKREKHSVRKEPAGKPLFAEWTGCPKKQPKI